MESIFYAVFAMKSESRIWRFKPRTSFSLTDVLSLKPVCQKPGVTEILTLNYFFNQSQDTFADGFRNLSPIPTQNNDLKVRYFWLTGAQSMFS